MYLSLGLRLGAIAPVGDQTPPDETAPVLSSPTGVETSPTTADLGVTTDENGGSLWVSVLPSADPAPSAAAFIAGTTGGEFVGLDNSPTVGVNTFEATGLTHTTAYKAHFFHRDGSGNESNIVSSGEFTTEVAPDVTAPVISSPTAVESGHATADIGIDTNEANGTWHWYVSESATPPSDSDLKDGTGAVVFGSKAVSATGTQSDEVSGLDAETTYYVHNLHRDAAGNDSDQEVSASFTTDALPTLTAPVLTQTSDAGANPLSWSSQLDDVFIDEDGVPDANLDVYYGMRYRVDDGGGFGSWIEEDEVLIDSDFFLTYGIDAVNYPWPLFTADTFAGGDVLEVEEWVQLNGGSRVYSDTLTDTLDGGETEDPTAWHTTTGVNKYSSLTVNGTGNLVVNGASGFNNAPISVRATQARTGKRQFEITLSNTGSSAIWLGVDDGTDNFGDTNWSRPGRDNSTGVCIKIPGSNGAALIYKGSALHETTGTIGGSTNGNVWTLEFDTDAGTVSFFQNGTQVGATVTGVSLSNWYANVGLEGTDILTTIFASGQSRALSSGYSYYDIL